MFVRTWSSERKFRSQVVLHFRPQLVEVIDSFFRQAQHGIIELHSIRRFGWCVAIGRRVCGLFDFQPRQDRAEISVGTRPGILRIWVIIVAAASTIAIACGLGLPAYLPKRSEFRDGCPCRGLGRPAPLLLGVEDRFIDGFGSNDVFQNAGIEIENRRARKGTLQFGVRPWCVDVTGYVQILCGVGFAAFVQSWFLAFLLVLLVVVVVLFDGSEDHVVGTQPIGGMDFVVCLSDDSGPKTEAELEKSGNCTVVFMYPQYIIFVEQTFVCCGAGRKKNGIRFLKQQHGIFCS